MKMNNYVIADSSALISLTFKTDSNNQKAIDLSKKINKQKLNIIVPGEIITEIINVLGKKIDHQTALKHGKRFLSKMGFTIMETTSEIRELALQKFEKLPKSVSFTDCLVMAFADEYQTKLIFGFDEAFSQNSYKNP